MCLLRMEMREEEMKDLQLQYRSIKRNKDYNKFTSFKIKLRICIYISKLGIERKRRGKGKEYNRSQENIATRIVGKKEQVKEQNKPGIE